MTDEKLISAPDNPQPETTESPSLFDQPEGSDWFLVFLISYADNYGIEQGIALTVGGSLITGTLISGRTYFEEIAKALERGKCQSKNGDDSADLLKTMAESYGQFSQFYPKLELTEEHPVRQMRYVHLRNARVVSPTGHISPSDSVLWRGKLANVDGFMLGEITVGNS